MRGVCSDVPVGLCGLSEAVGVPCGGSWVSLEGPGEVSGRSWHAPGGPLEVPEGPRAVPGRSWGCLAGVCGVLGEPRGVPWGLGLPGRSWGVLGLPWVVLGSGRFCFVGS